MAESRDDAFLSVAEGVLQLSRLGYGFTENDLLLTIFLGYPIWTEDDRNSLLSGSVKSESRANEIGFREVTVEMVKRAYITMDDMVYRPPIRPEPIDPTQPLEPSEPERER